MRSIIIQKTSYVATFVGNANILKGTAQETEADILKVSLAGSIVSAVAEGKKNLLRVHQ